MRLGVLDQAPIRDGGTASQALKETLDLATFVDGLGYYRYWLAEHHNLSSLGCASPEILIPQVAAGTTQIRVGSGGIMLPHYSSLKVAEVFHMIEALYPGRIDLGIGRAPGADMNTARALACDTDDMAIEGFQDKLTELHGFLSGDFPSDHPYRGIRAMPDGVGVPQLWLLGSSNVASLYAANLGWAFSFAHFISPEGGQAVTRSYRDNFIASSVLHEPNVNLGVVVTCAETEEEALALAWSRWSWRVRMGRGSRSGIPSIEDALAFPYTKSELDYIEYLKHHSIYGTPQQVRDRLESLAVLYDVDEFLILTITYDFEARKRSYELIANVFNLDDG